MKKKYQFSKARKRMGWLCFLMDILIILISFGFINYASLPSALATALGYGWFGIMVAAFLIAAISVFVVREYDVIRGCLFETLMLVVEGIWLGITRSYMLTTSQDTNIVLLFLVGNACIIILTVLFHIDMVWYLPIKNFLMKGTVEETAAPAASELPADHPRRMTIQELEALSEDPFMAQPATDSLFSEEIEKAARPAAKPAAAPSRMETAPRRASRTADSRPSAAAPIVENSQPQQSPKSTWTQPVTSTPAPSEASPAPIFNEPAPAQAQKKPEPAPAYSKADTQPILSPSQAAAFRQASSRKKTSSPKTPAVSQPAADSSRPEHSARKQRVMPPDPTAQAAAATTASRASAPLHRQSSTRDGARKSSANSSRRSRSTSDIHWYQPPKHDYDTHQIIRQNDDDTSQQPESTPQKHPATQRESILMRAKK